MRKKFPARTADIHIRQKSYQDLVNRKVTVVPAALSVHFIAKILVLVALWAVVCVLETKIRVMRWRTRLWVSLEGA